MYYITVDPAGSSGSQVPFVIAKWECIFIDDQLVSIEKYDYLQGSPYPNDTCSGSAYLTEEILIQESSVLVYRYMLDCEKPVEEFSLE